MGGNETLASLLEIQNTSAHNCTKLFITLAHV